MTTHRIAVIPGDGIGGEVVHERIRVLDATVDTVAHRLTLSPRDNSRISGVLAYEQLPDSGLRIRGKLVVGSVDVTLRRLDERLMFRLLR